MPDVKNIVAGSSGAGAGARAHAVSSSFDGTEVKSFEREEMPGKRVRLCGGAEDPLESRNTFRTRALAVISCRSVAPPPPPITLLPSSPLNGLMSRSARSSSTKSTFGFVSTRQCNTTRGGTHALTKTLTAPRSCAPQNAATKSGVLRARRATEFRSTYAREISAAVETDPSELSRLRRGVLDMSLLRLMRKQYTFVALADAVARIHDARNAGCTRMHLTERQALTRSVGLCVYDILPVPPCLYAIKPECTRILQI